MGKLEGKVAIVTGASRGIGRAIAERLGAEGALVAVNYVRNADAALQAVAAIEGVGGRALAIQADVGELADLRRLFQQTVEHFGGLDILVQNAATFGGRIVAEATEEDFEREFVRNAKAAFFAFQEAARRISPGGRIIYISSTSTAIPFPGFSLYSGGKAAGEQFVKVLAQELGERQVTVNTVSPGFTETDMLPQDPEWRKKGAGMAVFNRLGQPRDVADVVAFLASDDARWITGHNIPACGGIAFR